MKKYIVALLIGLCALCIGQVDVNRLHAGLQVRGTETSVQLAALKNAGYDHVRYLPRAIPLYPGVSGQKWTILFSSSQLDSIRVFAQNCKRAKLVLIIAPDCWSNLMQGQADALNVPEIQTDHGSSWHTLDSFPVQLASLGLDTHWVCLEPYNEVGWFKTWSQKLGLNDDGQLRVTTDLLSRLYSWEVPAIRAASPYMTLILPGPGYGALTGEADWRYFGPVVSVYSNCYPRLHFYWRPLSVQGQNGSYIYPMVWPDPESHWKTFYDAGGVALWSWVTGNQPWTDEGVKAALRGPVEYYRGYGRQTLVTEAGSIDACFSQPQNIALFESMKRAAGFWGLPTCKWSGG